MYFHIYIYVDRQKDKRLNVQIRDQINNKLTDRHSVERQTADVFELKDTRFKHRKRHTLKVIIEPSFFFHKLRSFEVI